MIETAEIADLMKNAKALASQFKDSKLYMDYQHHKNSLQNNPLLLERVMAYKENQFAIEAKRLQEGHIGFDEEKRVAHQYTELSLDPVAGAFLACEYELLEVYKQVLDIICEACEMD